MNTWLRNMVKPKVWILFKILIDGVYLFLYLLFTEMLSSLSFQYICRSSLSWITTLSGWPWFCAVDRRRLKSIDEGNSPSFSFTAISANHIHLTIYYTFRSTFVQLPDMSLQTWSNASQHSLISATSCVAMLYLVRILTVLKMHSIDSITTVTSSSKREFALTSLSHVNTRSSITFAQSASLVHQMDYAHQ